MNKWVVLAVYNDYISIVTDYDEATGKETQKFETEEDAIVFAKREFSKYPGGLFVAKMTHFVGVVAEPEVTVL